MAVNARWRYNPFSGVTNAILIEEEEHTIEFHAEVNAYGFYANEGVQLDVEVPVILVENTTAQDPFTEIPKTIAPNAGQFRVDYDAENYFNTGFVNCNSSDNGKEVLFTYYGTGTIVHPTFRLETEFNLPGNLNVEGTSNFQGDVSLAESTGSSINANSKVIEGIGNPIESDDAVNLGFLNGQLPFRNYEELTTSGTWIKPDGVSYVYVEAIGGGGGGASEAPGGSSSSVGGGGASGEVKRGLIAVTTDVNYTIGAGGDQQTAATTTGNDGEDTIFSTITASGGKAGVYVNTQSSPGGSANGKNSFPGGNGTFLGAGGNAGNGGGYGGGTGASSDGSGTPATAGVANTGGGGGGGASGVGASPSYGAAGGSGIIRLWY